MDFFIDALSNVLNGFYPEVVFDYSGLSRMLLPCLIVILAAIAIGLVVKLFADIRRYSYVPVIAALIVLIAVCSFFPATLMQTGDHAANIIEQQLAPEQDETGEKP